MFTTFSFMWNSPNFKADLNGIYRPEERIKEGVILSIIDIAVGIGCVTTGVLTQWNFSQILIGAGSVQALVGTIWLSGIMRYHYIPDFTIMKGRNYDEWINQP